MRYVMPELMRQGIAVSFGDLPNIVLRLYRAIFDENFTGYLLTGRGSGVLQGEYRWVMTFLAYGEGARFEFVPTRYVVVGGCYGLMGTDVYGHDLWQGLLYGVRWALIIGLATSFLSVMFGTLYGITGGYFGGMVDEVMLRVAQVIYSLPVLPILILLAALFKPSIWLIILALVAFSWPGIAFVTRAMALQIRQEPYVESAIALGARTLRVLLLYVMPQVLPYVFASIALSVPSAIIAEASLSFLGVGDPSILTWGKILYEAQNAQAALNGYWWWVVPPGLAIALVGLSFIFIGSALDRILNPRLRR
ncbi:MAG: ABC transporter permease [Crenarchaeota archaeon]|nr:ABC transporter permease [Thermoproteota archaeon]